MSYAIEAIRLSKYYRQSLCPFKKSSVFAALSDINLKVKKGEIFGLLGPNGAGKTTLIKIFCALILPSSGKTLVNGYDVVKQQSKIKKSTGYCLESERSFYYRISGRQNLAFFASLYNLEPKRAAGKIEELLTMFGLNELADKPFMHYSTGARQKLNLARALLNDPEVIFMDEPTKSLDPAAAENFWQLLKEKVLNKGQKTIFFATHSLEEAERVCTRVAFMFEGKIKAQGSLEETKESYGSADLKNIYRQITAGE